MWYMCIPFLAIAQVLSTCDGHSCPGLKTEPIERGGGDEKCSKGFTQLQSCFVCEKEQRTCTYM